MYSTVSNAMQEQRGDRATKWTIISSRQRRNYLEHVMVFFRAASQTVMVYRPLPSGHSRGQ